MKKTFPALFLLLLLGCTGQDFLGSSGFDVSGTYSGSLTRSPRVLSPNDTVSWPCSLTLRMVGDSVTGTISTGAIPLRDSLTISNNVLAGHVVIYYEGLARIVAQCYDPSMSYAQAASSGALRSVTLSVASYNKVIQGDIEIDTSNAYFYSLLLRSK